MVAPAQRMPVRRGCRACRLVAALPAVAALATGCMAPGGFAPGPYLPPAQLPAVYGEVRPVGTKTVQILPVRDRLHPQSRALLAPAFSVSAYFAEAMKRELSALGISATLLSGPTSPVPANACQLEADVRWLSPGRAIVDVRLTGPTGQILLEKRAYTDVHAEVATLTHMVLRQIFADPAFREAIR